MRQISQYSCAVIHPGFLFSLVLADLAPSFQPGQGVIGADLLTVEKKRGNLSRVRSDLVRNFQPGQFLSQLGNWLGWPGFRWIADEHEVNIVLKLVFCGQHIVVCMPKPTFCSQTGSCTAWSVWLGMWLRIWRLSAWRSWRSWRSWALVSFSFHLSLFLFHWLYTK